MQKTKRDDNKPTEEILDLIRIANLAPLEAEVKGLIEFLESLDSSETGEISLLTGESFKEKIQSGEFVQRWLESIKPYPPLFAYVTDRPDIHNMRFRFQHFADVRRRLNEVVNYSEIYRKNLENGSTTFNASGTASAELSVDKSGKLVILTDFIIESLLNFDLKRFRRCPVCRKIFWAYRLNQNWCSRKCSNVHHQRLIRSNPKRLNEINEQRKKNREYKKGENKNGTL